jgi:hypothetical protein
MADIIIDVTEQIVEVVANNGAYPLPYPVYSVFGRTGTVTATEGDYSLTQLSDVTLTSSLNNQVLRYNGTSWVNSTITDFVPYTGATSDLNLGINNIYANNLFEKFVSITASGTQLVLTVSSAPSMVVTGSGGQTIKLPNATTLPNGATYYFNNNQSSGTINVNNNSNTLVKAAQSGSYLVITLLDNSIAAGSWDAHFEAPSNVSWSTNTFDYVGSITGATWNGVAVAINRGGTGATTSAAALSNLGGIGGSGTINTLPKFTGSTAIDDSNIQDSGSLITLGSNTNISSGALGVGTSSLTGYNINVAKNITGSTTAYGIRSQGIVQSDVTILASNYASTLNTAAASFTLTDFIHHRSMQGTIGAGSVVTNQYGYYVDSSMIGATNNYGFYSGIASGTNRWNLYMAGTANNYIAGSLGIGNATLTGYSLRSSKTITGATSAYGIYQDGTIQSDVTTQVIYNNVISSTQAASFTLPALNYYNAAQGTFGAGSAVTLQVGYSAAGNMIGAGINYGFRGLIPVSGSGNWNLYMQGTAPNYLASVLNIGSTTLAGFTLDVNGTSRMQSTLKVGAATTQNASSVLDIESTTQGFLPPRMTTTQKNAITSPATGLVVFDTTLGKLCVFSTTWQTITSI